MTKLDYATAEAYATAESLRRLVLKGLIVASGRRRGQIVWMPSKKVAKTPEDEWLRTLAATMTKEEWLNFVRDRRH
jgi:hypothetical protein